MGKSAPKIDGLVIESELLVTNGTPHAGARRLLREAQENGLPLALVGAESLLLPAALSAPTAAEAAARLGLPPSRAAVLVAAEHLPSTSGFAWRVGVGTQGSGADLMVAGLGQLTLSSGRLDARTLHSAPPADPPTIASALDGRTPAVFLDYDGTLTPIVADHTRTSLPATVRAGLDRLARACPTAIVSGRDLRGLRGLITLDSVFYAGSHGFEIAAPDGTIWGEKGLDFIPNLDAAEAALRANLAEVPGHAVERKRFSVAVHYRQVPGDLAPRVEAIVQETLADQPRLALGLGKKVFELGPKLDWHKGRAVEWLIERLDLAKPSVMPIYIGDDITDEHAFNALAGRGLGIVVRDANDRLTAADLSVADVAGVEALLEQLASIAEAQDG